MEETQQSAAKRKVNRPEVIKFSLSVWYLPAAFLLGFLSAWLIWGRDSGVQNVADPSDEQPTVRREVQLDGDPSVGPEDAPITIVEFSDFQCPFCVRWHNEVYDDLMAKYDGQIRFVYRDFPLYQIHPEAEPAAIAANCAGEQGKYWEFHGLLFNGGKELNVNTYNSYATNIGLDLGSFSQCLQDEKQRDEVSEDYEYATSLGVRSTPTFFINGLAIVGAQPLEVFVQAIDKELSGNN